MAILICCYHTPRQTQSFGWFIKSWQETLLSLDKSLDIRVWPDYGDPAEIECVLVWHHAPGELKKFPNLKCIISLGAGVEHVLVDQDLPANIPIVRVVDPAMAREIVQYVVVAVLNYVRMMDRWEQSQRKKYWDKKPPFNYTDKTVGVMGLGFLGAGAAQTLAALGLRVIAWSNSAKSLPGVKDYVGDAELDNFLSQADILVCLLPLTAKTENILNKTNLLKLPKDAYVINLARGRHLVDEDLIAALNMGHLSGACIDVFRQEPLPPDHPFWTHTKIRVTPHIASVTNPKTVAPQVLSV